MDLTKKKWFKDFFLCKTFKWMNDIDHQQRKKNDDAFHIHVKSFKWLFYSWMDVRKFSSNFFNSCKHFYRGNFSQWIYIQYYWRFLILMKVNYPFYIIHSFSIHLKNVFFNIQPQMAFFCFVFERVMIKYRFYFQKTFFFLNEKIYIQ